MRKKILATLILPLMLVPNMQAQESNLPYTVTKKMVEVAGIFGFDSFSDGLVRFEARNGLCGYLDTLGNVAIAPKYRDCGSFENGVTWAQLDDNYGYINKQELWIAEVSIVTEGLRAVKIDTLSGYLDERGEIAIKPIFDDTYSFSDGLGLVRVDTLYGYIDKSGSYAFEPQFQDALHFNEGLTWVRKDNKWYVMTKDGELHGKGYVDIFPSNFSDGLSQVRTLSDEKSGFVDASGSLTIDTVYIWARDFHNGVSVSSKEPNKWGVMNKQAEWIVEPMYEVASGYSGGVIDVKYNDKYAVISPAGKLISEPIYDEVGEFSEGLIKVREGNHFGYIDLQGNVHTKSVYNEARDFHCGVAVVKHGDDWCVLTKDDKFFRYSAEDGTESIDDFHGGIARVKYNGRYGYVSADAHWLFQPTAQEASSLVSSDGYAIVDITGTLYVVHFQKK